VNAALAQRQIALAGLALLAGIVALGLGAQKHSSSPKLPNSIPAPGGGWFQAIATSRGSTFTRKHVDPACGYAVGPSTDEGVANPVLPCDSKIYIQFGDRLLLTQVIARGPSSSEADFEIPPLLAQRLDLHGSQIIGWRYAR
jgi:hypothetical protein